MINACNKVHVINNKIGFPRLEGMPVIIDLSGISNKYFGTFANSEIKNYRNNSSMLYDV